MIDSQRLIKIKENKIMANNKKITKLSELEQVDGRLEEQESVVSSLDALFGTGLSKYKSLDKNDYINELNNYNTAELRQHATKVGIIPNTDVNRLKKSLLKEFDKFSLGANNPRKAVNKNLSEDKLSIGLKIMSSVK